MLMSLSVRTKPTAWLSCLYLKTFGLYTYIVEAILKLKNLFIYFLIFCYTVKLLFQTNAVEKNALLQHFPFSVFHTERNLAFFPPI